MEGMKGNAKRHLLLLAFNHLYLNHSMLIMWDKYHHSVLTSDCQPYYVE